MKHQSRLVESLSAYDPALRESLSQLQAQGIAGQSGFAAVLKQVVGQGYLLSSLDIFWLSGVLALLLIPLCWIVRKPAGGAVAVAAE